MKASATGIRLPEALDAKRALKQKQDLWEAERKKKKVKRKAGGASGKELMFKGEGKCHSGCTELGRADKDICGDQRRNRSDTSEPDKSCNERDRHQPPRDRPVSTHGQRGLDTRQGSSKEQDQAQQARNKPGNKSRLQEQAVKLFLKKLFCTISYEGFLFRHV